MCCSLLHGYLSSYPSVLYCFYDQKQIEFELRVVAEAIIVLCFAIVIVFVLFFDSDNSGIVKELQSYSVDFSESCCCRFRGTSLPLTSVILLVCLVSGLHMAKAGSDDYANNIIAWAGWTATASWLYYIKTCNGYFWLLPLVHLFF